MKRTLSFFCTLAAMHASASACAVCMGDPNSAVAVASNRTLFFLMGMVGFVFTSTGGTAFYLWRRGKRSRGDDGNNSGKKSGKDSRKK